MPGVKQAWPISAACWSPAMPAIGMRAAEQRRVGLAEQHRILAHLGQQPLGDVEQAEQFGVPCAL